MDDKYNNDKNYLYPDDNNKAYKHPDDDDNDNNEHEDHAQQCLRLTSSRSIFPPLEQTIFFSPH